MCSAITQFDLNPSSSSPRNWRYDVFLSFRGDDTRRNFTDHLYTALVQRGIKTFRDDEELPTGHEISPQLLKAIQDSRIAIVVFSKNYGNSRWCLNELEAIMKCKETLRQLVLPVFYHVDPSDVRNQKGTFEDAFGAHKQRYGADSPKLKAWRSAITKAANLSGWDLANGYEAQLIKKIIDRVLQEVNRTQLFVAKYPVGLDCHVKKLKSLLNGVTTDVRFVGIYGMGGVGKTTLSKHFYNSIFHEYEGSCFLANVREESQRHNGLVHLQEQLISELLMKKKEEVANIHVGMSLLTRRLGGRKVLIVLDDLDQLDQLNPLAGERCWFGKGSLVIITTRNQHLLDQVKVDVEYEVEELGFEDSVTLFSNHALILLKEPTPSPSYKVVLEGIVRYAGGLPLALEVLGSSLIEKPIEEWRSMLDKLKDIPNEMIHAKQKISFETLDDSAIKDIFLDIACFFVGMNKDYVIKILDGCHLYGDVGVNTLVRRSLLKIPSSNRLEMHDLVRDMGRAITSESFPKEPEKRIRLWQTDDVVDVLTNDEGGRAIEGIILDLPMLKHFSTTSFARMRNLRLLKINNVVLHGSFEGLFTKLRWLCWHCCQSESFPPDLHLEKLVCLDLQKSNFRILWSGRKLLSNLKEMDLRGCEFLTTTPDFSGVLNLEMLRLDDCKRLSNIDSSIGLLNKLKKLSLSGCRDLRRLPSSFCHLTSLETLFVYRCSNLEGLPEKFGDLESLWFVDAWGSGIKELPDSIGNLYQLGLLRLGSCINIKHLPSSICNLQSLEYLDISKCPNLERLPEQLGKMHCLRELYVPGTSIKRIPLSIGLLHNLTSLYLGRRLYRLPSTIAQLSCLEKLEMYGCRGLRSIVELPPNLLSFRANDCTSLEKLPNLSNLIRLRYIQLRNCSTLVEIQGLENHNSVETIDIDGCSLSLSRTTFESFFFQAHFEDTHRKLECSRLDMPNFFERPGKEGSAVVSDVPPHIPPNSYCATIWVDYEPRSSDDVLLFVQITNKTNDDKWTCRLRRFNLEEGRLKTVIHVPYCFKIKSGDHIQVSLDGEYYKCGVHLKSRIDSDTAPTKEKLQRWNPSSGTLRV